MSKHLRILREMYGWWGVGILAASQVAFVVQVVILARLIL